MAEGLEEQTGDITPRAKPELKVISSTGSPFSILPTSDRFWVKSKELRLAMIAEALEVLQGEEHKPDNIIARDYPAVFTDVVIDLLAGKKLPYLQNLAVKHHSFVSDNTSKAVFNFTLDEPAHQMAAGSTPTNLVQLNDYRQKNQVLLERVAKEWAARTMLNRFEREDLQDNDLQAHIKHITETPGALDNAVKLTRQYISDCLTQHELEEQEKVGQKRNHVVSKFTIRRLQQLAANDKTETQI